MIATAVAVSWTARALGMDSHAAAVLGAVLSPTDAAAVAGLAKKLPRRSVTVLKAESLINDGTALVLFAVTVHVAITRATLRNTMMRAFARISRKLVFRPSQ
nr:cation:proton antiporter [Mycobacterium sp. E1386]